MKTFHVSFGENNGVGRAERSGQRGERKITKRAGVAAERRIIIGFSLGAVWVERAFKFSATVLNHFEIFLFGRGVDGFR